MQRLRLHLSDIWHKWRMARRLVLLSDAGVEGACVGNLDMKASVEQCGAKFWEMAVNKFELDCIQAAKAHGHEVSVMVMDGNMKNRRSACATLYQNVVCNDPLRKTLRLPCQHTPLLGSLFCRRHEGWKGLSEAANKQVGIEIVEHRASSIVDCEDPGLMFKVQETIEGEDAVDRWVREEDLSAEAVEQYLARVGRDKAKASADRRNAKARKQASQRAFLRRTMEEFAPMWDALTPEERAATLALYSAESDLKAVACNTHKEDDRAKFAHAQTAGLLCACLSSGLIVRVREIFGTESLSQRYFFVADLKKQCPDLDILVHDDACHLHKYTEQRSSDSVEAAQIAPESLKFVCDHFHVSGHTDPWCLAHCHPDSPPFAERLKGIRTSVCEFTFTWLSRYRMQTKHMSEFSFKWFVLEMVDSHNHLILECETDHLPQVRRENA